MGLTTSDTGSLKNLEMIHMIQLFFFALRIIWFGELNWRGKKMVWLEMFWPTSVFLTDFILVKDSAELCFGHCIPWYLVRSLLSNYHIAASLFGMHEFHRPPRWKDSELLIPCSKLSQNEQDLGFFGLSRLWLSAFWSELPFTLVI